MTHWLVEEYMKSYLVLHFLLPDLQMLLNFSMFLSERPTPWTRFPSQASKPLCVGLTSPSAPPASSNQTSPFASSTKGTTWLATVRTASCRCGFHTASSHWWAPPTARVGGRVCDLGRGQWTHHSPAWHGSAAGALRCCRILSNNGTYDIHINVIRYQQTLIVKVRNDTLLLLCL